MRIEPKTAAAYAAGAFLFLLIFGVGWPGPGTWLLVFSLSTIAAGAAAWWLDGAIVQQPAGAVVAGGGPASPFAARRGGRGAGRPGDSLLLSLGFPGPDRQGRWVLPDRVHLTAVAGAVGLLALIIFAAGALGGGGEGAATSATTETTAPAIDFAATTTSTDGTVAAATPTTPTAATQTTPAPVAATQPTAVAAPPAATPAPPAQVAPIVLETPTTPDPAPARPLEAPSTLPTAENSVVHEVVAGDTLYDLAIYYGSSIEAIMSANGLSEDEFIMVGDRLVIPAVENSGGDE
ncbi:MAG: LysM domain-containing protein [Chloroflexi bacterium]|nr:LysM domain-containing protein [Chloroflexota bacterium]